MCPEIKRPKCFCVISSTKLGRFWRKLVLTVSWINLLQHGANMFHLTWMMSLHYLVKLEMLSTQVLQRRCQRRNSRIIPSHLWPPNSPDFDPVDYSVWEYCKKRCTKHASLIWMNWNSDWEWSGPGWITLSLQQPFINGVIDSCRSMMHVLYTSLAVFPIHSYQLDSNLANLGATVEVE